MPSIFHQFWCMLMSLLSTSLVIPSLKFKWNCPWIWRIFLIGFKKNFFWIWEKTKCLLYGTRQRLKISGTADFSVTLDETPIKFSTVFKYLGVMLYNHLSFNEHIDYVASKVSQKLGILSREWCYCFWSTVTSPGTAVVLRTSKGSNVCKEKLAALFSRKSFPLVSQTKREEGPPDRRLTRDAIIEWLRW